MREIHDHKVQAGDPLTITVTDDPGSGGAHHAYLVTGFDTGTNPSHEPKSKRGIHITFQNGTIPDKGVNGLTNEVLLAIVADRLRCFQAGNFACKANAEALRHVEEAMHWHQQRTIDRMRRGVEGAYVL